MHFTPAIAAASLAFAATSVLAAPLPQLAGEGAACNSILSSTDNGVGYGIENAEDNIAKTISGRQLAGEGAACNSILSSTDNSIGYGIEDAEDNTAAAISSLKPARRQLDKIANGAQAIGNAAGVGATTSPVTTAGDNIDGSLTGGVANLGAQIGDFEVSTLEGVGSAVPKSRRQLDKISNGFQSIGNAAGVGDLTSSTTNELDGIDGSTTSGAANLGAEIGNEEVSILEAAGSAVP